MTYHRRQAVKRGRNEIRSSSQSRNVRYELRVRRDIHMLPNEQGTQASIQGFLSTRIRRLSWEVVTTQVPLGEPAGYSSHNERGRRGQGESVPTRYPIRRATLMYLTVCMFSSGRWEQCAKKKDEFRQFRLVKSVRLLDKLSRLTKLSRMMHPVTSRPTASLALSFSPRTHLKPFPANFGRNCGIAEFRKRFMMDSTQVVWPDPQLPWRMITTVAHR